ncbi:helix-turn-helix domain-containing protein [Streptobacillus moniliformis]|uniref:helix-turn-helix domain-containing protein n=1 Tax=Streptobacillus moniliformis TaxID=34105 RepID=UPI0007E4272E|nr:helix-turn-helix transcriptional regulator [Streptobacillus moniliformis]QXW66329.1 helix-turn-helix domain-containing protein [Streptobacillus moniliformis]
MKIGEKLKIVREELNFTIKDISKLTKIPIPTLYGYENGHIKNIPNDKLVILANLYGKDLSYFLDFKKDNIILNHEMKLLDSLLTINEEIIIQLTGDEKIANEINYYMIKRIKKNLINKH